MSSLPNLLSLLDLLNLADLRSRKYRLNELALTRGTMTLIKIQKNGEVSGEDLETSAGN